MDRKYYRVRYRLDGLDSYLIWYSDDRDGVVEADGRVVTFRDLPALHAHAERRGLTFEAEEPSVFDFDAVEDRLDGPGGPSIDCVSLLNAWNLLDDVASTIQDESFGGISRAASNVYEKLFWGNNIPAMTSPGEHYVPNWTVGEVAELRRILRVGVGMLRNSTKVIA